MVDSYGNLTFCHLLHDGIIKDISVRLSLHHNIYCLDFSTRCSILHLENHHLPSNVLKEYVLTYISLASHFWDIG